MNINHIKNYDLIKDLPTDEIPLSNKEIEIFNILFKENEEQDNNNNNKLNIIEPILVGFIFVILSLPCINNLLFLSENMLLLIKTLLIIIIFWICKIYVIPIII